MPANLGVLGEVLVGVKFGMEQALRELNQLESRVDRAGRNIQDDLETPAKRGAAGLTTAFRTAAAAAAAFGVALGAREIAEMADSAQLLRARLNVVTGSTEAAGRAFNDLARLALSTRQPLEETTRLYTQLAFATDDLGASHDLLLAVTENISKALAVSGTEGASAAAALFQLSQGLSSGTLRGEELNSVLEQARPIAKAIGLELGSTVGQLRALAEQGKLTPDIILAAMVNMDEGAENIDAQFAKLPVTIGQAFNNIRNSIQLGIDAFDQASGTSSSLATSINDLAVAFAQSTGEIAAFANTIIQAVGPIQEFFDSLLPDQIDTLAGRLGLLRQGVEAVAGVFGVEFAQAAPVDVVKTESVKRAADLKAELAQIRERASAIAPATKASADALDEAADRAGDYREAIEDLEFEADFAGASDEVREFAKLLKDLGVQAAVTGSQTSLTDLLTIGTPTGVEDAERLLELFKRAKEGREAKKALDDFTQGIANLRAEAQIEGLPEDLQALGEALQNASIAFKFEGGELVPVKPEDAERLAAVRQELEGLQGARDAGEALRDFRDAQRDFAEGLADIRLEAQLAGLSDEALELASALRFLNVPFAVQDGSIIPVREGDAQRLAQVREEVEGLLASEAAAQATRDFGDALRSLQEEAQLEGLSEKARETARELQNLGIAFQIQGGNRILGGEQFVGATQAEQERINQIQAQVEANRRLAEESRYVEQAQRNAADATNTLFEDIVFRSEDAGDALENFAKQIARDFVSQALFQPISQGIGALLGGVLGMFNPFGFLGGGLFGGFAKGAAFSKGNVIPFARGGLINHPTVFPMAKGDIGLMGEAGPEAVVPLRRGADGGLGVSAEGLGATTINFSPAIDARGAQPGAGQDIMRSLDQAYNIFKQRITNDLRRNPGTRASAGIRKG